MNTSTIIAILLALGLIFSAAEYRDMSDQEQQQMYEIVESDIIM